MCELFGFSSARKKNITPQLTEFFSHSQQHPHGWGLAFYDGEQLQVDKEAVRASASTSLQELLAAPINTTLALGHIRLATIGHMAWNNCHPFSSRDLAGRRWTLIHNGTIFSFPPMDRFYTSTDSDTDSACLLAYILAQMNESYRTQGRQLSASERFAILDRIVAELSPGNKVNLMIYDEELLYVHTNYQASLYQSIADGGVMFSTQPLTDGDWSPVPFTQLLAYQDGQLIYSGRCHGAEYHENPEQLKLLYLAYSGL